MSLTATDRLQVALRPDPVRVVALDVTLPGRHHGDVDDDALRWLDGVLASGCRSPKEKPRRGMPGFPDGDDEHGGNSVVSRNMTWDGSCSLPYS